ncbi:MAG: DNA polymerase III subunit delta' [Anaerolineae bacterium]|jgi:DNA polymerase-3 subunit delta'|nr:DNA polymerase III subunit delta' [Chloroflexota bacterium]
MWQTIGHSWAIEQLTASIARGNVARASLFTGPEGIGKTTLALEYAAALNCVGEFPPCGQCPHCRRVLAGTHPDVFSIEPDNGTIKIGQIRQIQRELSLTPYEAKWRVAIVSDVHTASEEAANALLKTLEEPPAQAVLILTAREAGLLLPTVVSRCRVTTLQAVPADVIAKALEARGVPAATAGEIARLAGGHVGWALAAITSPDLLQQRKAQVSELLELLELDDAALVARATELAKRADLPEVLRGWQLVWRDIMLMAAGCRELIANPGAIDALERQASNKGLDLARQAVADTQKAALYLEQNVNTQLVVETLLLGWTKSSGAASLRG